MDLYRSSVRKCLLIFAIVPTFVICIVLSIMSNRTIHNLKTHDTEEFLRGVSMELAYIYGSLSDDISEYKYEDGILQIRDKVISNDYSVVDRLGEYNDVDLSVFYFDKKIVTTLIDDSGKRYINTQSTDVWEKYVKKGKDFFTEDIVINGINYYGYYTPIYAGEDIVGMSFAGKPSIEINNTIRGLNFITIIVCIVFCLIAVVVSMIVTIRFNKIQDVIIEYINEIDKGRFKHQIPEDITKRKDEYGIMSRSFVALNDSLCSLIHNDALTGLYNRRAGMNFLNEYVVEANKVNGETFTFAIGDIDFFKKVNDTYGHNCGDEVLKEVSKIIGKVHGDEGFACRWGGEEFVIGFKGRLEPSKAKLEKLLDEIRDLTIDYDNFHVKVTMTFGITEYIAPRKLDWLISNADILLYKGKESGRNKIVS